MQTQLAPQFQGTAKGREAEDILRKCVHCGFCTATCPTYQVLGDELDGPRGRIYMIKQVLEGAQRTQTTQMHLDRCLTCRNCETTCPSGVDYGHLLEIGRAVVDERVQRPLGQRLMRWTLRELLTSRLFAPAMRLGRWMRPVLPGVLKNKIPVDQAGTDRAWPVARHKRRVLLLQGCVQPAMAPNINRATARVLDALGVQTLVAPQARCCGALRSHLSDEQGGLDDMRRCIDAWWPYISQTGVEAIIMNASGCGVTVKDYAHALAHDPDYADKARVVSELTRDLSEWLPEISAVLKDKVSSSASGSVVFHPPCTLQHGQRLRGGVQSYLNALGFQVSEAPVESHLCCGSAGAYSVLEPAMATTLRDRKLNHLHSASPAIIVSANIGCIQHLQSGTQLPVRHWVELLDDALG